MPKNWRRGKSKNHAVTNNNTIVGRLQADYIKLGTWIAVGDKYGITSGMAWEVARGYNPRDNTIRRALGMPTYRRVTVNPPQRWADMSVSELRRAIENRREYP